MPSVWHSQNQMLLCIRSAPLLLRPVSMLQQIDKLESEAQKRQIRKILWIQLASDSLYVLIFLLCHAYQALVLFLLFQVPINIFLWRISVQLNSRLKTPLIILQNFLFFVFAMYLGERAQVQLLFLSSFLSHIMHLRPKRWHEWLAVSLAPILWNVLEFRDYNLFQNSHIAAGWALTIIRFAIFNSSFVFLFLIFDFLRLRYLETQNEWLASSLSLRQAKSTIERQQTALVQHSKMQALGEMAGGIAHEINNPLSIIEAQLYTLKVKIQKSSIAPQEIIDSIQAIEQTSNRISHIIKGLLEIAGDGSKDPFKRVSLQSLLRSVEALCQQRFQHHGIDLLVDKHIPASLHIFCRQAQIAQVLLILLSNAFDAVCGVDSRWVKISVNHDAERILLIIADSGPGLTPQQRDRLFQPFSTSKPIGKGTGLGLSIAKGIVDKHQGSIWLDTSASFTTFKLELPLSIVESAPS